MTPDPSFLLRDLSNLLAPADGRAVVAGLKGSAPAYLVARLLERLPGPLLVIAPDAESGEEFCRELRFYAGSAEAIRFFPHPDTGLLEAASPHPDVTGERLGTLVRLLDRKARAVVVPLAAALQRVLPRDLLGGASQYLITGEEVERDTLLGKLVRLGYASVPLVEDRGTFAVRGGILDIFPPDRELPVRIEFFGDAVETIREFDPLTQRSLHPLAELVLLPSREVILSDEVLAAVAGPLKERCDDLGIAADRRREL